MASAPFQVRRDGSLAVRLSEAEADVLRRVAREMAATLDEPDESTVRLFPPAYADDPDRQAEFARMTRDDLHRGKVDAARAVAASIDAGTARRGAWSGVLDDETAEAWLATLNDARLVIGTRLDVTEDMDHEPLPASDPDAAAHNLYVYLSALEAHLVEALAERRFGPEG